MKNIRKYSVFSLIILILFLYSFQQTFYSQNKIHSVVATMQTQTVDTFGDKADDPCIYINPKNNNLSLIIATDKDKKNGGLRVYDVNGKQLQFLADGAMNNVDLRYKFLLGKECVTLVVAGNRTKNSLAVYKINEETNKLENISSRDIVVGIKVYGSCMYKNKKTNKFYVFVNDKQGKVQQWLLFDDGKNKVDAKKVRMFSVSSQTEGCVADDDIGKLYLSEETVGIWKFDAESSGSYKGKLVDKIGKNLTADVEGLTIYCADEKTGYLIASSQGNNTYSVYKREGENEFIGSFKIIKGDDIDGTSCTDGIDVTHMPFGEKFVHGLFVAQDGSNSRGKQNFKCVSWKSIAQKFKPNLKIYS